MTTTEVLSPTSWIRFGHARADITTPVGIYQKLWGAARHSQATGIHRPLYADVMAFAPVGTTAPRFIRTELDLCVLSSGDYDGLVQRLSEASGVPRASVAITCSHTHSAGSLARPEKVMLPGMELIPQYVLELQRKTQEACQEAVSNMQEVVITYAAGRCGLATNRDYRDEVRSIYACGFNPDSPADDTVIVARITDVHGRIVRTVVNYGCHPTTLAWKNSLTSPDYVGAVREVVEQRTGVPCIFLQGACGELGPKYGFVGETEVADQNGRQLGYAALSALESAAPPATDFHYDGPVVSGATLGIWTRTPFDQKRREQASSFTVGSYTVDLPIKALPSKGAVEDELKLWESRQREADRRGDTIAARDAGAYVERATRWLSRLENMGNRTTYPYRFTVCMMGDAMWVTCEGEPYNAIQTELRRRFPDVALIISPLEGGSSLAYLLPSDRFGKGLYQEEVATLAAGSLEALTEAVCAKIGELRNR